MPADVQKSNGRAIAQYVADEIGAQQGFIQWQHHETHLISDRSRGLPRELKNGHQYRFRCSQQSREHKVSQLPFSRTRNRRCRKQYKCSGSLSVFIPDPSTSPAFDVAFKLVHELHPGRQQFEVHPKIREWIMENPRPTPLEQRNELYVALQKGELDGVKPDKCG